MIRPTTETIRAALSFLSPDLPREEWVKIGMAVKDGLNGEGFPLFDEWSSNGASYNAADCRDTWKSIKADGRVTVGTLFYLAQQAGWKSDSETHRETESERQAREEQARKRKEEAAQQEARKQAGAMLAARAIYGRAHEGPHPYADRKGFTPPPGVRVIAPAEALAVRSFGPNIREDAGPWLIIPIYGPDGELCGLAAIDTEGGKGFMAGGSLAPFIVGTIEPGKPVAIAEGLATALSIREATGYAVAVAFSAATLRKTAEAIRAKHPGARILIAADAGNGEADARKAAEATGAALAVPELPAGMVGKDFNDLHQGAGLDVVRRQIAAGFDQHQRKTYTLLTSEDLAALPPTRWKIKGLFPESGTAAIYGPPGSGKSFLALDVAGAIGAGREWFGRRVVRSPVVYLCLEGEGGLRNRVAAYRAHHGGDSLTGVRFVVESFSLLTDDPVALVRTIQAAGMEKPMIVVDTLSRAAPGADENSGVDMGRIIEAAKVIQAAIGGLVVLVHHSGKDASKDLRGHSSLRAALDAVIAVRQDGEGRKWNTKQAAGGKVKDGADDIEHAFGLQVHHLGEDEDGDPITSCVVVPDDTASGTGTTGRAPLSKSGSKALDILSDLYERQRSNLAESGKNPDDARVTLNSWCEAQKEIGGMPKNRAYEGRTEARQKGYVRLADGFAYLVPDGTETVPSGTGTETGIWYRTGTAPPLGGGTVPGTGTDLAETDFADEEVF